MSTAAYLLGVAASLVTLVVVLELLRRRHLRERHAVWWILASLAAVVVGLFPGVLTWAATVIGIEVPTNLVFFLSIAILVLVALQHSAELTRLEERTRTLAERVALLELRLDEQQRPARDDERRS